MAEVDDGVQVDAHNGVGAVVAPIEVTLPVKTNVPVFGRVYVPVLNVVALTVMFQPALVAVWSLTENC